MPPNQVLPVILILDGIRSLHNIGSLFRTADAANIESIILSPQSAIPPRFEIEKTALGATKTVPWQQATSLKEEILALKQKGYLICALEQTPNSQDIYTFIPSFPLALILGHERQGVEDEILTIADIHLQIPMHGRSAHSLNVANAGSIALYEIGRRFWYH